MPLRRLRSLLLAVSVMALLACAVLALSLVAAPAADAKRRPSGQERSEIANAVGVPKRCLRIRVSTVSERWAVAWMDGCGLDEGSAVFRFRRGLWREGFTGPESPESVPCSEIDFVRAAIARDLSLCV